MMMMLSNRIKDKRSSTGYKQITILLVFIGFFGFALIHVTVIGVHFDEINREIEMNVYVTEDTTYSDEINNTKLQHRLLSSNTADSFQRLAILRATDATTMRKDFATERMLKAFAENPDGRSSNFDDGTDKNIFATAIFLQVGYTALWDDMLMCTSNVAAAISATNGRYRDVDVYVALLNTPPDHNPEMNGMDIIEESVTPSTIRLDLDLPSIGDVFIDKVDNVGADIGNFMHQLKRVNMSDKTYDLILKMHTKGDQKWRERGIESLCGTPEQVLAIFGHIRNDPLLDMINPQGTTFGPDTLTKDIYPHITRKYDVKTRHYAAAFDKDITDELRKFHRILFPAEKIIGDSDIAIVAGSMFWIRYSALHVPDLIDNFPLITEKMTRGYTMNGGSEHVLERLFATQIIARERNIAEMPPAPRMVAMYFPQFHPFAENDRFWGKGFTEWTILKPLELVGLHKPLPVQQGGLGYYDLRQTKVRRMQAELARSAGLSGFIYYHYWFSGKFAPDDHKVMYKIQEAMLLDGEPDLPFALSWANEPWTKRWTGVEDAGSTLLSQEYGDESEWREHFEYLLPFFQHPNYICEEGKPVFIIYRIGHIGKLLEPMLHLWRKLALEAGLPGIHFVNTIGNFRNIDSNTADLEKSAGFDAAFHFWPQNFGSGQGPAQMNAFTGSVKDLVNIERSVPIQYWGSFTGFDRRPRDKKAKPILRNVEEFSDGLHCSFLAMGNQIQRNVGRNLYFVTAWNEWNEQATLEPDDINGFGYLKAIRAKISEVPRVLVASKYGIQADFASRNAHLEWCKPKCHGFNGKFCDKITKKYLK